jgi:predicted RNA-binding Zn ribbon-like protein
MVIHTRPPCTPLRCSPCSARICSGGTGTSPPERLQDDWQFDLSGSHLALDFANTVSQRHTEQPIERLTSYGRLVGFAQQSGLLSSSDARRLRAHERRRPDESQRALRLALELREALYRLFAAVAQGRVPDQCDLAVLNDGLARMRLSERFAWEWAAGGDAQDAVLLPVLRAAVELLTGRLRERIRVCDAEDCVWLFLDTSKNRSRRWCDMSQCGNRAKARRWKRRHRGSSG